MKKIMIAVFSAMSAVSLQLPCAAAEVSPNTGDVSVYVIVALVVAAAAIVGTVLYTKFKK